MSFNNDPLQSVSAMLAIRKSRHIGGLLGWIFHLQGRT